MTKHQIDALISRWLEDALDEAEDERAMQGRISEAQREDSQLGLSELFDGAREALADGDCRTVTKKADELLRVASLPALGVVSSEPRSSMHKPKLIGGTVNTGTSTYEAAVTSLPFSDVMEKYLASSPRPPRTANPMRAEFLRFMETLGGDRPIGSISRADVVRYKERLQAKKQSPLTLIKHLSGLDALFKWAEVHAYTPAASPVKGLVPSKRQAKKQALKRQPFTDDELLLVLSSQEFLRQRMERSERYWLVLLLLFQICRREEAAQPYLKDIGRLMESLLSRSRLMRRTNHSRMRGARGEYPSIAVSSSSGSCSMSIRLGRRGINGYSLNSRAKVTTGMVILLESGSVVWSPH